MLRHKSRCPPISTWQWDTCPCMVPRLDVPQRQGPPSPTEVPGGQARSRGVAGSPWPPQKLPGHTYPRGAAAPVLQRACCRVCVRVRVCNTGCAESPPLPDPLSAEHERDRITLSVLILSLEMTNMTRAGIVIQSAHVPTQGLTGRGRQAEAQRRPGQRGTGLGLPPFTLPLPLPRVGSSHTDTVVTLWGRVCCCPILQMRSLRLDRSIRPRPEWERIPASLSQRSLFPFLLQHSLAAPFSCRWYHLLGRCGTCRWCWPLAPRLSPAAQPWGGLPSP